MTNYTIADEQAPLSFFKKNGYYTVGNKIFNHKITALEEATQRSLPLAWEFNSDVYGKIDWTKSVDVGLEQLYQMRAQQLRDQYDYLILSYSGGSDSTTALRSFLDNGIHLDEIIVDWSMSQTVGRYEVSSSTSPENYISEWDLAIKPMLEYVQANYPAIKITVTDSISTLTVEDYEDTCIITQIHNYVSIKRYRTISNRLNELNDQFDSVALVLGIDKPIFYIKNHVLQARFCDNHCWFKSSIDKYKRNIEYFYWTPDLPEITVKQAQVIYAYVKLHPVLLDLLASKTQLAVPADKYNRMNRIIKRLIYPEWDNTTFQANKGTSLIYNEQYAWFFTQEKTIEIQSWESSMNARLNLVDRQHLKFFDDGKFYGYKRLYSQMYPIGPL
jgi:hypothetical protein